MIGEQTHFCYHYYYFRHILKMGHKKGYNWKAREQPGGSLDMAEVKQLNRNVDLKGIKESDSFTGSNSLVLPAKKLKFTVGQILILHGAHLF